MYGESSKVIGGAIVFAIAMSAEKMPVQWPHSRGAG